MGSILIVDGEEDVRDSLQYILVRAGHDVKTSSDSAEAVALMRREPADMIISDIILPEKDGVSTIKVARAIFPGVRIIAILGGGCLESIDYEPEAIETFAYLAAARKAGADVALSKPFQRKDLIQAVDDLLIVH